MNAFNTMFIGSPGSGKSVGAAADAVDFPGAIYVADPHTQSLAQLVFEHISGNVLFERLSDTKHSLPLGLLPPHQGDDPDEAAIWNQRYAHLTAEILVRRRSTELASMPLCEEWLFALLSLFLFQRRPRSQRLLQYGFHPETEQFQTLLQGCTVPALKSKFRSLVNLSPRSLRSEVGSAARLVNSVFRSPHFLARCDGIFPLDPFVKARGKLLVERGNEIDEDATTTIISARTLSFIDYAKSRAVPYPPIRIYLDECTNAKTAGKIEERAAGELRKNSVTFCFICQHPNFIGGADGYFQNCPRKEIFRTADRDLARKMAAIIASENPEPGVTRTSQIESLTSEIMNLQPGWRFITGPGGSRFSQYVVPLKNPWPDWPGLREAKLQEKLACIYNRTEYRRREEPTFENFSPSETLPLVSSPDDSSPALRWRQRARKQIVGSAKSEDESESMSAE
jgi:hypothetical protein